MPWAVDLLPMPIKEVMIGTAIADIIIGIIFLSNSFVWFAALTGTIHLIAVLVTSGINEGTVRDIGLLASTTALVIETLPENFAEKLKLSKTVSSAG